MYSLPKSTCSLVSHMMTIHIIYRNNMKCRKKLRKEFFLSRDPCEESSGRADDGEDRRGAVRAGGAGRWFCLLCRCNHPALPTRSKVNDWEIKRASIPRKWRESGRGKWGARKQDPQQNITSTNRISAEPGDTEQRLETRQGAGREPREARPTRSAG